jgi:alanyl aminopeptidase
MLGSDELDLHFPSPLPTGILRLVIDYDAPFAEDVVGLYRVHSRNVDYAYTQFEPTGARRAFPCFDNPRFRTPYDLTLITPPELTTVANAPETHTRTLNDGRIAHRFQTTAPLPSYLVAFAVGTFDVVEGRTSPFPIRAITPKGLGSLSEFALNTAPIVADRLAEYFGTSYPFPKLDLVAVPGFAPRATDHPGLIMVRDAILLASPNRVSTYSRHVQTEVLARELAHQWLGDLVTIPSWDESWLIEGLDTWAATRTVDEWQPSYDIALEHIARVDGAMDSNSLGRDRTVREIGRATHAIDPEPGELEAEKGAALARMIEQWVGPEIFRRAVRKYLADHAWGVASGMELFSAVDYVSTFRAGQIVREFVAQSGVPEVRVSWHCDASGGSSITLQQARWTPLGTGRGDSPARWTVPVCVSDSTNPATSCFTLGPEPITREHDAHCPKWVYPNAGQSGYYRFTLGAARLLDLARHSRALPVADRVGLIDAAWDEVRAGSLDPETLLHIVNQFDSEDNPVVVEKVIHLLYEVELVLLEENARPGFESYVRMRLGRRKASLGWESIPRVGQPKREDAQDIERRAVLSAMSELAHDRGTIAQAQEYAAQWLAEPSRVAIDVAEIAVPMSSVGAPAERLQQLRAMAADAPTLEDRLIAIRAMGALTEPQTLSQALDLTLTDEIRAYEIPYLFESVIRNPIGHRGAIAWEEMHGAELLQRVPTSIGIGLVAETVRAMCDTPTIDGAAHYFLRLANTSNEFRGRVDMALQAARQCVSLRARDSASLTSSLTR